MQVHSLTAISKQRFSQARRKRICSRLTFVETQASIDTEVGSSQPNRTRDRRLERKVEEVGAGEWTWEVG